MQSLPASDSSPSPPPSLPVSDQLITFFQWSLASLEKKIWFPFNFHYHFLYFYIAIQVIGAIGITLDLIPCPICNDVAKTCKNRHPKVMWIVHMGALCQLSTLALCLAFPCLEREWEYRSKQFHLRIKSIR